MARAFRDGYRRIATATGSACTRLVGAGNGVRENPVLAGIIAEEFGLPLAVPTHRGTPGAAPIAALGAGIFRPRGGRACDSLSVPERRSLRFELGEDHADNA
jgi:sugar (pentulose or hexulose) kinase